MAKEKKATKPKAKKGGGGADFKTLLKKYGFWVATGLLCLLGVIGWFLGTGTADTAYAANVTKITGIDGKVKGLIPKAPNDEKRKEYETKTHKPNRDTVLGLWKELYDAQQKAITVSEKVVVAGGAVEKEGLTAQFLTQFRTLPPLEKLPKEKPPGLESALANEYRIYVDKGLIGELCDVLKAPVKFEITGAKGAPAGKEAAEAAEVLEKGQIMFWDRVSQQATYTSWTGIFPPSGAPKTVDVLRVHQSFAVHQAIFRILANVNAEVKAEGNHNAIVKRVLDIKVGDGALESRIASDLEGLEDNKKTKPAATEKKEDQEAALKELPEGLFVVAKTATYVDAHGRALKLEDIQKLGTDVVQFKRVPVYLKVLADQRQTGLIMREAMKSPFKFRIEQCRIVPEPLYDRTKRTGEAADAAKTDTTAASGTKKSFYDLPLEMWGWVYVVYPPASPQAAADKEPTEEPTAGEKPAVGG